MQLLLKHLCLLFAAAVPMPMHKQNAQRVFPAMLQRALPQLGPPSRVKRVAQAHRNRQRRLPNAQQKMQQRGVVQRRVTTLEKWDNAAKQQVRRRQGMQHRQQGLQ